MRGVYRCDVSNNNVRRLLEEKISFIKVRRKKVSLCNFITIIMIIIMNVSFYAASHFLSFSPCVLLVCACERFFYALYTHLFLLKLWWVLLFIPDIVIQTMASCKKRDIHKMRRKNFWCGLIFLLLFLRILFIMLYDQINT